MKEMHVLRLMAEPLRRALRVSPVVVLTGARQTGKTTLARMVGDGEGRRYVTLDDVDAMERARREPDALVAGDAPVTLDEVQRSPELLLAVKRAVDARRRPGRFLLTGSADLLLMERVADSLAGRAVHLALHPLTAGERAGAGRAGAWDDLLATDPDRWEGLLRSRRAARRDWRAECLLGGYPVPALLHADDADARVLWLAGYVRTYLERDLRELAAVASLVDFRRLMRATCLRLGGILNQAEIARDVGLSAATVHRHLALLEASCQVVRLPPYSVNLTKRLVKSPKAYWNDPALALHLAGETEPRGAHLENLVLGDLLAWSGARTDGPQVLFWRTASGVEVDFVLEAGKRLLPVEVKATVKPRLDDAAGLRAFRGEYGKRSLPGIVLHGGDGVEWIADGVLAAPWWRVL